MNRRMRILTSLNIAQTLIRVSTPQNETDYDPFVDATRTALKDSKFNQD